MTICEEALMKLISSFISGWFFLSVLVLIHEFGHLLFAKMLKVKVLAFSVGFGKPLLKYTFGETEYRLSAIPFGGYNKFAGGVGDREHQEGDFSAEPVWKRIIVILGGPLLNIITAIIFSCCSLMIGVETPSYLTTRVGGTIDNSPAEIAGIFPGDSIVEINGKIIESWNDLHMTIQMNSADDIKISFLRNDVLLSAIIPKGSLKNGKELGIQPPLPACIGMVNEGSPAQRAGMKKGDCIIAINGENIASWFHFAGIISGFSDTSELLQIKIARGGDFQVLKAKPIFNNELNHYILGVTVEPPEMNVVRYGFSDAISLALKNCWDYTSMVFKVLNNLFERKIDVSSISGPVGIMQISGIAVLTYNISKILELLAIIGINLAVMNLLPLVITDGGQLLFLFVEIIRRKPLAERTQNIIVNIAAVFFILLAIYLTVADIIKIPRFIDF